MALQCWAAAITPLTPLLVSRGSEAGDEGESFAGRRNDCAAGDLNPGDRSKRLGSCRIANGLVEPDAKTASAVLQSSPPDREGPYERPLGTALAGHASLWTRRLWGRACAFGLALDAEPRAERECGNRWVETWHMVAILAAIADEHSSVTVLSTAHLTFV